MTRLLKLSLVILLLALLYLLFWPVPVDPVAWEAPPNPGYTGDFEVNEKLKAIELLPIGNEIGPEDLALGRDGLVYAAVEGGRILQLADGDLRVWAETGGRPLGIEFDSEGRLIVADAIQGLLAVEDGETRVLVSSSGDFPIGFANELDIAPDGKIYFSDSTTRFSASEWQGTLSASVLEVIEHSGSGRLLEYDPQTGSIRTVIDGLQFANGVAVSSDGSFVLVAETAAYRINRYWLSGPNRGTREVLVRSLPGFPDNLTRGLDGRFWLALVSSRLDVVDSLAGWPFLRKITLRLPGFLRPQPISYGHVIAFDGEGKVLANLQDPEGAYPSITSVLEEERHLYFGSLEATGVGRLRKSALEL